MLKDEITRLAKEDVMRATFTKCGSKENTFYCAETDDFVHNYVGNRMMSKSKLLKSYYVYFNIKKEKLTFNSTDEF